MNNESGSALQKANFVLLTLVLAALGHLIVRDRLRDMARAEEGRLAADTIPAPDTSAPPLRINPVQMRTNFAPLRPRVDTASTASPPTNAARRASDPSLSSAPVAPATVAGLPSGGFAPEPSTGGALAGTRPVGQAPVTTAVTGRVLLRGTPPAERPVNLDPICARVHPQPMLTRHYVIGRENGLADTFVYIKAGLGRVNERQTSVPVLDNVQCQFQPYVLGVRAGQPFEMRNSDSLLHNVHGTPRAPGNREFNLAMPLRGMSLTRVLPTPEVFVRIKCDVHPWMFAYLGVVEHPWFAVTDRDGRFTLPNGLPVGRYTIAAVHVKAGEVTQEISVTEGGAAPLEFVLDVPQALTRVSP